MNIGPKTRVLAAGENVANLLAGELHEFLRTNSMVWLALNGDANGSEVQFSFISGLETVVSQAEASEIDRAPVWPDDFLISDAGLAGDRLTLQVRNTNGAATRTIRYALRIEPTA
jgi:hypothetical protein